VERAVNWKNNFTRGRYGGQGEQTMKPTYRPVFRHSPFPVPKEIPNGSREEKIDSRKGRRTTGGGTTWHPPRQREKVGMKWVYFSRKPTPGGLACRDIKMGSGGKRGHPLPYLSRSPADASQEGKTHRPLIPSNF